MTIEKNAQLDTLDGNNQMAYARGRITLVAGVGSQAVPGFSANAQPYVSREIAGGVLGDLKIVYALGVLQVNSANAGDTSTVSWLLID